MTKTTKAPTKRAAAKTSRKAPAKTKTRKTAASRAAAREAAMSPDQIADQIAGQVPKPALDDETRRQFIEAGLDDDQIEAIMPLLQGIHQHGSTVGRMMARGDVAADLRWLAQARADYDVGEAPAPEDMSAEMKAAVIRAEHQAASWLAGIVELRQSPVGWFPSWHMSGWKTRLGERDIEVPD